MRNHILTIACTIGVLVACTSKTTDETVELENIDLLAEANKVMGEWDACAGMNEETFRRIFEVPASFQMEDVSAMNVSKGTCVMIAKDSGGAGVALMVQLMSLPSTYTIISNGFMRDFDKVPEDLKIKGLGKAAIWADQQNAKQRGIVVVGNDHVVSMYIEDKGQRDRSTLQPMLEEYYRHWLKSM